MNIVDAILTINPYSRPNRQRDSLKAIVLHWVANPHLDAMGNRNWFESRKDGKNGYGSAHYIIGWDGTIVQCIPEGEVAYHVGSTKLDPASGQVYTDYARATFGQHYCRADSSPNNVTIGIELCHKDWTGQFQPATLEAARELIQDIVKEYSCNEITTHNAIVGYKQCPLWFVTHTALFDDFKSSVLSSL
jgi:N-acetylmuramoyl-L-alanine amidase